MPEEGKAFEEYKGAYIKLRMMIVAGNEEAAEAEELRCHMDTLWRNMTAQERMCIGRWAEEANFYPWQKTNAMRAL